jgi:hypothetical protein
MMQTSPASAVLTHYRDSLLLVGRTLAHLLLVLQQVLYILFIQHTALQLHSHQLLLPLPLQLRVAEDI